MLDIKNLSNESLYCQPLLAGNINDIQKFKIEKTTGIGLETYLKQYAVQDETRLMNRTYLIRDRVTDEIAAYFSLKAGSVKLEVDGYREVLPGIEVSQFAANDLYKAKYKVNPKIGTRIFNKFILPVIQYVSTVVGISTIYIYALPYSALINYYKSLGFVRLPEETEQRLHQQDKPTYDQHCIFMYQRL